MHMSSRSEEPDTLGRIRRFLLAIVMVGLVGTLAELLLLGHFDSASQWIPLVLLACGIIVITWHGVSPGEASVRTLQMMMALFVAAGVIGVGLHYDGNVEFELEITPTMSGLELARNALTGATPVMAPATMALLGLVGLAHTYRHPVLRCDEATFSVKGDH